MRILQQSQLDVYPNLIARLPKHLTTGNGEQRASQQSMLQLPEKEDQVRYVHNTFVSVIKEDRHAPNASGLTGLARAIGLISTSFFAMRPNASPYQLNIDVVTRAVSFFFSQYVHQPPTPCGKFQPGSFQYLPSLYARSRPDGPLVPIVHAAALASYANAGNVPRWTLESYRLCGLGILRCRHALGNLVERKSNDVLASIMLLGVYETIALKGTQAMKTWSQHMLGAAAVIDSRGPGQFHDRSSVQIFLQIRRLIVLSAYQLQQPVPFSLKKWSTWLEYASVGEDYEVVYLANRLSEIVETLASVRAFIKASKTRETGDISSMLLPIDLMLQSWRNQLPTSWLPVPRPACRCEDCSSRSHFEGMPFDAYPNLYVASLWNNYRGARILVHEMLLSTATSSSITAIMDDKELCPTINLLRQMSTEICLSVDYHLRPIPDDSFSGSVGHLKGIVTPSIPGGELLIWPLFMAGMLPTTIPARRMWISDHLRQIGANLGIGLALSMSQAMDNKRDTTPFSHSELWARQPFDINDVGQRKTTDCYCSVERHRQADNPDSIEIVDNMLLSVLLASIVAFGGTAQGLKLPIVDLGYGLHQAIGYNDTLDFYNFSNIRYAQPPTGRLRFTAPQSPLVNRTLQDGSSGGTCPQAYPVWYLCGLALLGGSINSTDACDASLIPKPDPTEQEDCLFLDVIVPKEVFANASKEHAKGAPVMVWVYGGGFTFSKKYEDGNPAGLIQRSREEDAGGKGVVYVTFNYRGGAFGFLSGPNIQSYGTANAGLLDQRMALEWVQQYIHLFGGDPKQVTVFGQSAGAGSIMHQITAYGGLKGPAPFQRAILQSPGFEPFPSHWEQDHLLQRYLGLLNVSTIQEARELPFAALSAANVELVATSPYGTFTFAPAVDGDFVPSLPGNLLAQGNYDTSVQLMTGFNAHETLYFTNPASTNNSIFLSSITSTFPGIQASVADYVAQTLYPPVFNGSYPYSSFYERAELTLQESAFTCNTFFLQTAGALEVKSSTKAGYGYRFSVPPAYHGQDVAYTYYNPSTAGPSVNATIALFMQRVLTRFALTGNPNRENDAASTTTMPAYFSHQTTSGAGQILDLNVTGLNVIADPNDNDRCLWWQKSLYY
ncbi:hypothetical protein AYO20_00029 [Fonsecaea nubica]|uniref:Carboxylesterase type B domain-containing protein n=1 Tax=Fonsecaea nubica TaxID=856822 RepID=A0A178DGF4_9EURO|nr:hypothetical protein AYO20_00029 [Fonsecaea nubica]OAL40293.1 hypothetical protein AYO20_00029 [Fonsecaea nubica]